MSASQDGIQLPREGDRLVERYTVMSRVSYGGFGAVYKAIQDTLGREVAIKVLLPEIFVSNKDYVEQFRQEALLTSQLRHPNTITIFDYGQTDSGLLFLVMEWLDGGTLAEILRQDGALDYQRCYHISYQILKSLAEAHERGMVHRDLKPSNLFLCTQYGEADYVKVLDFGLVKNLQSEPLKMRGKTVEPPKFTEKRRAPGTPHYMAPEQATGKGTTTSADMYSFGLILQEMMTGKRAVDGTDKMEVLLRQAREKVPPLPKEMQATFLGKIVARCVAKDPLKRPQTARDLIREYQRVEDTDGVEVNTTEIRTTDNWKPLAKPKSSTAADISSGPQETFVGRTAELQEFDDLLDKKISQHHGLIMTVSGPTGIGKSALVQRYADVFTEKLDGLVLRGGFLPSDNKPLTVFRRALKASLGVTAGDHTEGRHEIRGGLERLGVNDIYLLNFLSNFLLGTFGSTPEEQVECASRIEDLLDRLAQTQPVMFVLENLHWADAESLEFVWRLGTSPTVAQRPLLLIATFRSNQPKENRELQLALERLNRLDHAAYRELRVGPLGKRECLQIIEQAINMQRRMANRSLALSRGNPLFLNLVLRYLIDEAEHISRQASDQGLSSTLYLPSSLEKISLRRVEQVVRKYGQEHLREVLRRAALVGESFPTGLLKKLLRKEAQFELIDKLARTLELWRREGLLRKAWESEATMEFIHPHLVEFFVSDSEKSLHLLVARTKEQAMDDEGSSIDVADLARHFMAAGEADAAIEHFDLAARNARDRGNLSQAKLLFQEMLPLFGQESHSLRHLARRVNFELGEICRRLSEFGPSGDYYDRALTIAQTDGDKRVEGAIYCGKADLALAQNHLDEADRYFHRARGLIADNDQHQQGVLLLGMGRVSSLKGDWEAARSCYQRAYDHGAAIENYELMARALHQLGRTAVELGNLRTAHEWLSQALKYDRSRGSSGDVADVLLDLAHVRFFYCRMDEARELIEEAIEIEQRLGDRVGVALALVSLGRLEASQLNLEEAQKFVLRALPIFNSTGHNPGLALSKEVLAGLDMMHGYYDKADSLARQALELVQDVGGMRQQTALMAQLARISMYDGRVSEAAEMLSQAEMLLDVHGSDANRSVILHDLARVAEATGDFQVANNRYERSYEVAQRCEWVERQYLARVGVLKINLFYQGGRWYADEMWAMAHEARSYSMRETHLQILMDLAWFEGVYGDQVGWEAAIGELNHYIRLHNMPARGLLKPFDFRADCVRHLNAEAMNAFQRSAGWLRKSVNQAASTGSSII